VLVVHGTWNPPTDPPTWHQLNEADPKNFCTRLNSILESKHHLGKAVWRNPLSTPVGEVQTSFAWSGANRHEDRVDGALQLLDRIRSIIGKDPDARIHLIGHSHGCNVVIKCVEQYLKEEHKKAEDLSDAIARRLALNKDPREALESDASRIYGAYAERVRDELRDLSDITQPKDKSTTAVRRKLHARLGNDRSTMRLGRVVFLGPVFFRKRWFKAPWWSPSFLAGRAFNLLVSLLAGASAGYLAVLYFWAVVTFLSKVLGWIGVLGWFGWSAMNWPDWNPFTWHWALYILAGFYMLGLTIAIFGPIAGLGLRDVNLYFDDEVAGVRDPSTSPERRAVPLECLVVTAGVLDEVLLAFSAEPLVYGTLVPQIHTLTRAKPQLRMPARPSGLADMPNRFMLRALAGLALWVRALLLSSARPLVHIFERHATNFLLKIIAAPAYGLPPIEFEDASVNASADPGLEKHFAVTRLDAQDMLMAAPLVVGATGDAARYRFVVDQAAMAMKVQHSWLVKQMEGNIEDLFRRRGLGPEARSQMLDDFNRTCVILEERLKEFSGAVQLTHSSYYTNDEVIDRVAQFLAHGVMPGASAEQDFVGV